MALPDRQAAGCRGHPQPDPAGLGSGVRELVAPCDRLLVHLFHDGAPRCSDRPAPLRLTALGILAIEVEVIACRESAAGLEAALAAGWQPVPSPAPASV